MENHKQKTIPQSKGT